MSNNTQTNRIILFLVVIILAILAVVGYVYLNAANDIVEAEYENKIVYKTSVSETKARMHCAAEGGEFNACGSSCAPDAEACTEVCAFTCDLSGADNASDSVSWTMYRDSTSDLSFRYPEDASVTTEAGRIKVTYLGPDNTMGSEITDGFTFYVRVLSAGNTTTLDAFADERFTEESENVDVLQEVEPITIDDRSAYRFIVRSMLGIPVTHVITNAPSNQVFDISYTVSDPNNVGYQTMVNEMIENVSLDAGGAVGDVPEVSEVSIALLDPDRESGIKERGCDLVALVSRDIEPTTMPLTAAMEMLFSLDRTDVEGFYNFMAKTNDTLSFDRTAVENGIARIYLTGELSGLAGVCDDPRAQIQIEETALQFPTVHTVEIYLNGELTDLRPDARGQ